jgi:hypothetical protein
MSQVARRRTIKLTWKGEDGKEFTTNTEINGTEDEIIAYYMGNVFNIGRGPDDYMAKCMALDFTDVKDVDIFGINADLGGL